MKATVEIKTEFNVEDMGQLSYFLSKFGNIKIMLETNTFIDIDEKSIVQVGDNWILRFSGNIEK